MRSMDVRSKKMTQRDVDELLARTSQSNREVEESVRSILEDVRDKGDKALLKWTAAFDKVQLDSLKVTEEEIEEAYRAIDPELLAVLQEAAENIRLFHEEEMERSWVKDFRDGVSLGQLVRPVDRAGLYVPGGKAGYPSTVLMAAIPAKVAGVPSVAMISPPNASGKIDPVILATAKIAGIHEIYKLGGAQGVAALAYGTESIEPVNTIVGPGNIYVATAKQLVFGQVSIDMIAGPSEVCIISDGSTSPTLIASDLLAQAEHDELATPLLISMSPEEVEAVRSECYRLASLEERKDIILQSLDNRAIAFLVENLEEAFRLSNLIAPEHLELLIDQPRNYLDQVIHAGAVFLGQYTPEPVGDYFAGPNHTLPTSGTARFSSGLGVKNFLKTTNVIEYSGTALEKIYRSVEIFAKSEGLHAHANSIGRRFHD